MGTCGDGASVRIASSAVCRALLGLADLQHRKGCKVPFKHEMRLLHCARGFFFFSFPCCCFKSSVWKGFARSRVKHLLGS